LLSLAILSVLIMFYQQQAATKYVMMEVPTVYVEVIIPETPTRTATPTPRPTMSPTVTTTPLPIYGQASPEAVMMVTRWTPTPFPTRVTDQGTLVPCDSVTAQPYEDTPCRGTSA
jgi:hypothetical protein